MTHPRAVVQGIQLNNIRKGELAAFWIPCMESVKRWAEENDWDYHCFHSALDSWDTEDLLNIKHRKDKITRNGQFYKWQWVNSVCDQYDEILWLDSDIYVWGNPVLPLTGSRKIDNNIFKCMNTSQVVVWTRPNLSIFWSSSKTIRELHDWNVRMLNNPSERGEIYSCLLTLARHGFSKDFMTDFTEEVALIDWVENNQDRVYIYPYERPNDLSIKCDWAYDGEAIFEACTPDSFLHFTGIFKQRMFQKFRAYKAYEAQLSKGLKNAN